MESSFLELKSKQVINTVDGKCLGHITDVVFDVVTSRCLGFVVPQPNQGFWGFFRSGKDIFIPFDCVCKLGIDAVLVELYINEPLNSKNKNTKDCAQVYATTQNREK